MKHEKMIQAMDLLDEKFMAEADPANAKNIRIKRTRNVILRIASLVACATVVLGGGIWLNHKPVYIKLQRNIVETYGYIEPMGSQIADVNNYEAITELSSQIVLCEVKNLLDVSVTDIGLFSFRYEIVISDIFLDVGDRLEIGDTVQITSSEGILKAADAADLIADTPRAKKLGILQGEYTDEDYVISSTWNAIPIEVGNCYLMYLDDDYLETEGVYAESGRSYLYEYHDQSVYSGRDMIKNDSTLTEIMETVGGYISTRTGRADEIGDTAYMLELGERQNREKHPEDYIHIDNITAIHQLFVMNEITDIMEAAPKYRDPEQHYYETWDYDKMAEYLNIDLKKILEVFSQAYSLYYCGADEFTVVFENSGQIVEDVSSYKVENADGTEVSILASKLRTPYDCIYRTDTETVTSIPIPDSGETLDILICGYTNTQAEKNTPMYVADFIFNGIYYRITAKKISTEQLAELIYIIVYNS